MHGAGATFAAVAPFLRTGQAQPFAQEIKQRDARFDLRRLWLAVDRDLDRDAFGKVRHGRSGVIATSQTSRGPFKNGANRPLVPAGALISLAQAAVPCGSVAAPQSFNLILDRRCVQRVLRGTAMVWLQLAVILVLILLNGFFAMAELAVVSSRRVRLQAAFDAGRGGARLALSLKSDLGRFLSTVQIGITVIGVLAGVFGGATLADDLAHAFAASR